MNKLDKADKQREQAQTDQSRLDRICREYAAPTAYHRISGEAYRQGWDYAFGKKPAPLLTVRDVMGTTAAFDRAFRGNANLYAGNWDRAFGITAEGEADGN